MDEAANRWLYEFGAFRLDAGRRVLSRTTDSARIPLSPKVFDASLYLVERAGEVVAKARMLSDLWPGFVVEENSLTQVISTLRRALGEDRCTRRYVVTVPRRGYQFVADVTRYASANPSRGARDHTVAVLPFMNLGHDAQDDRFATGVAESILHRLAGHAELRTIAQTSSFACRAMRVDARVIGRTLDARYLVEGSIQHAGPRLRITVQLIDTDDGSHVWSLMFDRTDADVFAVEDDVSSRVARAFCRSLAANARTAARAASRPI